MKSSSNPFKTNDGTCILTPVTMPRHGGLDTQDEATIQTQKKKKMAEPQIQLEEQDNARPVPAPLKERIQGSQDKPGAPPGTGGRAREPPGLETDMRSDLTTRRPGSWLFPLGLGGCVEG